VRPLRLVEMQLTTAAAADRAEFATGSDPPAAEMTASMAEYDRRRCVVCGCRHPSFGFGPPLHSKGTIWACGAHRTEVERQLRDTGLFSHAAMDRIAARSSAPKPTSARPERDEVLQLPLF